MRIQLKPESLREALVQSRLSQNRLAIRLGLSSGQLSELANGRRLYPSSATRQKLLEGLGLEFDDLFEIVDEIPSRHSQRDVVQLSWGRYRLCLQKQNAISDAPDIGDKMSALIEDLRHNLLTLKRKPGFSFLAIFLLSFGIAANSAVYQMAYQLLWAALPYKDAGDLVLVSVTDRGQRRNLSFLDLEDLSRRLDSFEAMAGFDDRKEINLLGGEEPLRVLGATVTKDFFPLLGLTPVIGRALLESDFAPTAGRVAVISERLWERSFGRDPSLLGQVVRLNGLPYQVVGIMPAELRIPNREELWVPLQNYPYPDDRLTQRGEGFLEVIARLEQGRSIQQARAEVAGVLESMAAERLGPDHGISGDVWSLREEIVGNRGPLLRLLAVAMFALLLIVCVNLAGLQMARLDVRRAELAIRASLGADRRRLIQQVCGENFLLSFLGGSVAVLLTPLLGRLLASQVAVQFPTNPGRVLLLSGLFMILSSILFGILPAVRLFRNNPNLEMISSSARSALSRRPLGRLPLVAVEIALSLVLISSAGLLIRSLSTLTGVDPGFDSQGRTIAEVSLPVTEYADGPAQVQFFSELLARLENLPGVEEASAASLLPLASSTSIVAFRIQDRPVQNRSELSRAHLRHVWPGYFQTLGIPLLRGRAFELTDRASSESVVVVDRALADRLWPGEDPIGKLVSEAPERGWRRVVGVVGSTMHWGQRYGNTPTIYASALQLPTPEMTVVVRSRAGSSTLGREIRQTIWALDPNLPVYGLMSFEERLRESQLQPREMALLLLLLASLAVVLSSVGLYAVISQNAQRRRQEIGLRMAIGAGRIDVLKLVLGKVLRVALPGVAAGVAGALLMAGLLKSFLFGVQGRDPWTLFLSSLFVLAISLVAGWLPARRAARIDPAEALRTD